MEAKRKTNYYYYHKTFSLSIIAISTKFIKNINILTLNSLYICSLKLSEIDNSIASFSILNLSKDYYCIQVQWISQVQLGLPVCHSLALGMEAAQMHLTSFYPFMIRISHQH